MRYHTSTEAARDRRGRLRLLMLILVLQHNRGQVLRSRGSAWRICWSRIRKIEIWSRVLFQCKRCCPRCRLLMFWMKLKQAMPGSLEQRRRWRILLTLGRCEALARISKIMRTMQNRRRCASWNLRKAEMQLFWHIELNKSRSWTRSRSKSQACSWTPNAELLMVFCSLGLLFLL